MIRDNEDTISMNTIEAEPQTGQHQKGDIPAGCPFAAMPPSFWQNMFRPPFRKRHPVLFWILVFLGIIVCFRITINWFGNDDDEMAGTARLALVRIEGPIINSENTVTWIDKILRNPDAKGLLVIVNSPGGGAAASQEIYFALKRAAAKLPVCVSMGATAASGGYMVSMAGERIFALPSTITGSIGVRMDIPQLQGLMEKVGVGQETLVSGPFKDAASYTHPLSKEDRAYLQGVIDNMHGQFVEIVAEGRKISREKAAALANGKVYTGQQAKELGLVDELGGEFAAREWLAQKTGVSINQDYIEKKEKKDRLLEWVLRGVGTTLKECLSGFVRDNSAPEFRY